MKITAFLPCRAGSRRVPNTNTRPFADEAEGLLGIKLAQLMATREIDEIVLSTHEPLVIEIGSGISKGALGASESVCGRTSSAAPPPRPMR
jgi:CMP-N-acetylneuraminic acid synthetase